MNEVFIDIRKENELIKKLFTNKDYVSVEDLLAVIEELQDELDHKDEVFEDYKQYVADNYRQLTYEEQVL